jgi:hypothetical protein
MAMALPALAAPHPAHYVEPREAISHHARAHSRTVQADSAPKSSRRKSRVGKSSAAKSRTGTATHSAKLKHHKRHPQDEADNDPLVLHRVNARRRNFRREDRYDRPRAIARRVTNSSRPLPETRASAVEPIPTKKAITSEDFTRAAGGSSGAPEVFEHGQSHPDDDERFPMGAQPSVKKSPQILAEVSAASEPITPVGKTTLHQEIHTAATNVETAMKSDAASAKNVLSRRGRARANVLPEDHDDKVAVIEEAMTPMVLPTLYTRHGRLIVPRALKGSRAILVHQNEMADSEGLDRIQNDDDLDSMRDLHLLVSLNDSAAMRINEELPANRRYARPWTARFAVDTSRAFYSRFHQPLRLNSAVRTVDYQLRLQRVNGNAASVDGDGASPHLTGQAIDFGKRGMSIAQIAWMRAYLAPLMRAGKVDVEEEFQQACFHISVYRGYGVRPKAKSGTKMEVARADLPTHADSKIESDLR